MSDCLLFAVGAESTKLLTLTTVDKFIIGLYFVMVIAIGFYLKKYASTGEDFFMAGRKMSAWIAGLSFISANLSSLETMGWSAMAYQHGMIAAHAYFITAIPQILFLAVVMLPFYYICKTHSVPGYLSLRYGEDSRVLSGISFAFMTVLICGVNMYAMAIMLKFLLGWNIHVSIWVSSLTVAVYVTLGGLLSAVLNEVLQFFLIWLGTLLVPILGLYETGGWSNLMARLREAKPDADFTSLWAGLGSANDNAMGIHWYGIVFGWGVIAFGYWCTDFLQVQRVMAAKSLRAAQNGTIIGAAFKMFVPLIVTIPGLLGLTILTQKSGIVLLPENEAVVTGGHSYNEVLPLMMARYLGPGLLGLGVTAMIAGFMSGMAGNVSAFATVWTYDVYRALLYRNGSDAHYLNMGRWCSIIGVIIAIGTAYAAMLFSNILVYLQVLLLFFIVPLFGVVILGMLWKQATKAGGFWGLLVGTLFSVSIFVFAHWFPAGYAPFLAQDIKDLPSLVQKLEKPDTPAAQYVASQLSPKTVEVMGEYKTYLQEKVQPTTLAGKISETFKEVDKPVHRMRIAFFLDLNRLLKGPSLYDADRFAGLNLSQELQAQAKEPLEGNRRILFNRALLDVVFPGEFASVRRWEPTRINPRHSEIITTSPKGDDSAVNFCGSVWSFVITVGTVIMVSLFTTPKPDHELKDLVFGLTPLPDQGKCAWYQNPVFWAAVVFAVFVIINIILW